jgi:hypothetical protein
MWHYGTISACCVNSACYLRESWRQFASIFKTGAPQT